MLHAALLSSFLFLSAGDALTTCRAFNQGFVEGNPIYMGTDSCMKVTAIKGGITSGVVYLVEKKVKTKRGKIVAYALLAGVNAIPVVMNTRAINRR